jgi:cytochrome c-type biogenesis protein CcmH
LALAALFALALPGAGRDVTLPGLVAQVSENATTTAVQDSELEARVKEVASQLRCPVCRALSVYDSPSGMAQEMKGLIRDQLRAGRTPEQVKAYFVERYGEWILLEPKASGFNWSVWLLPVAMIVGGLAFVLLTARRWVARGREREAALTQSRGED